MTIGFEAERANVANVTGVEKYAAELIRNLAKIDQKNHYVLYFRTEPQSWFKSLPSNFTLKVIPFPKFWTQTRLAWELFFHPVDVFFMAIQALPFIYPRNSIITVHDLAYEFYPKAFAPFMRNYLKLTTRWGVRRAKKIIAVSESTKRDVAKTYSINPGKIFAAPLGLSDGFKPLPYDEVQAVLDKYSLTYKKYLFFVSTLQPRKNIVRLVDAYVKLRKENHIEEKLVIAGGKGWLWEPILEKIKSEEKNGVVYLNYLPVEDLSKFYVGASVLAFPSIYEGFGLAPLEAMASGTPVVVSNVSSMPEVVGEAGVLVDPNSVESIAAGLLKVLTNKNLQAQMSTQGIEQAKKFTWVATAQKVLAVIESVRP